LIDANLDQTHILGAKYRRRTVKVLPVKATFSMSMCEAMAAPAVLPYPVRTFTTPGGNPAWAISEHMRMAVRGVNSEGLRMTVFPVASAGPIFHAIIKTV
jgi:hypothetical protein